MFQLDGIVYVNFAPPSLTVAFPTVFPFNLNTTVPFFTLELSFVVTSAFNVILDEVVVMLYTLVLVLNFLLVVALLALLELLLTVFVEDCVFDDFVITLVLLESVLVLSVSIVSVDIEVVSFTTLLFVLYN